MFVKEGVEVEVADRVKDWVAVKVNVGVKVVEAVIVRVGVNVEELVGETEAVEVNVADGTGAADTGEELLSPLFLHPGDRIAKPTIKTASGNSNRLFIRFLVALNRMIKSAE